MLDLSFSVSILSAPSTHDFKNGTDYVQFSIFACFFSISTTDT